MDTQILNDFNTYFNKANVVKDSIQHCVGEKQKLK